MKGKIVKKNIMCTLFIVRNSFVLFSPAIKELVMIICLFSDLMEHSLGVNTFQLAKKLVDKVITVRYCTSTLHL